jgi:hypothetical protein
MNKHFVIHPDGTKSTRNSENRVYTHAIAVSPLALEVAIEQFTNDIATQEASKAEAVERVAALKKHGVTITERVSFGTVWADFQVNGERIFLNGIHRPGDITVEEATAQAISNYEGYISNYDKRIAKFYDNIATTKEQGHWGNWGIVTWCGRYDLAVTQFNKWSGRRGYTAQIVEVERVGA